MGRFPGDVMASLALLSVLGSAVAAAAAGDDPAPPPPPVVSTRSGRVRGRRSHIPSLGRDVDEFLAIPFAQPPLGPLRFRHPLAVRPWRGIRNATAPPASCYQVAIALRCVVMGRKKWDHKLVAVILSDLNRFTKCFHWKIYTYTHTPV